MRVTETKTPVLATLLAALLLAAIPQTAQAQFSVPGSPSGLSAPASCAGLVGVALCQCSQNNTYSKIAQDKAIAVQKVIAAGPLVSMKIKYCWNSIVAPLLNTLGAITSSANGSNPFGAAFWTLIFNTIIQAVVNRVCAIIAGAVASAISMLKSWMCIPLPHFNLSLGGISFKQGSCNGINLFNLLGNLAGQRPVTPNAWGVWGYTPPGGAP